MYSLIVAHQFKNLNDKTGYKVCLNNNTRIYKRQQ